jgi:hypothetical protein
MKTFLSFFIVSVCVVTSLCVGASQQSAVSITIKVLDATTGNGLSDEPIWLIPADGPNTPPKNKIFKSKTDRNGVATILLTGDLLKQIWIEDVARKTAQCSGTNYVLNEVLHVGVVANNSCMSGKKLPNVTAKPGELVIYARHLRWWERGQN